MGGVDLVGRVLKSYSSQRQGVKWYRKLAELYIDIAVYNSFIIYKKLNGGSKIDHFNFLKMLIEELIMFHASGGSSYSTGPNPDPRQGNFVRLVERHFISQIPSTASKPRAQRKFVRCTKFGIRRDTRFWCWKCNVALCLIKFFSLSYNERHKPWHWIRQWIWIWLDKSWFICPCASAFLKVSGIVTFYYFNLFLKNLTSFEIYF